MIRRDDGDNWLLISQRDHARLAGEIAAVWGNNSFPMLPRPDWLVPVVARHDDGWRMWERAPQIDPDSGRPRDFTEMPMDEATAIWRESLACCGSVPMGRLWVSRHFQHLAEKARESRKDVPEDIEAIDLFLEQQGGVQEQEASATLHVIGKTVFTQLADIGYRYLQFFDRLSLWICCAAQHFSEGFTVPNTGTVRFTPGPDGRFRVEPFPLSVEQLELSASAKRIPARRFDDDSAFRTALSSAPREWLRWTIMR